MPLPKGPLLAPIGRNMQEVHVEDIAKEIAAEFQKTVPVNMSHQVNVTVDPIELEGLEDSNDADRIVAALNSLRTEDDPDKVDLGYSEPILVTVDDAERADEADLADGERENESENMLSILESIDQNTNDTVDQLLDVEHAIRELGKSKEDDQDEDEEQRRNKQKTNTGDPDKDDTPKKEEKKGKGIISKMFGGLMKTIKSVFGMITTGFLLLGGAVLAFMGPGGIEAMKGVLDTLGNIVNEILPPILEALSNVFTSLMPALMLIADVVGEFVAMIAPMVSNLLTVLLPPVMQVFESLATLFSNFVAIVAPIITYILDAILPPIANLFSGLLELLDNLLTILLPPLGVILGVLGFAITGVVNAISFVVNALNLVFGVLFSIKDGFDSMGDNLKIAFGNFINGIIDMGLNLLGWIPGTGDIQEKLRSAKIDTEAIQERIDAREEAQVQAKATEQIEKQEIDMDAPRAEVVMAVKEKVKTGKISEEVGQAIIAQKDEKDALEGADPQVDGDATPVMTLSDLFEGSIPDAEKARIEEMVGPESPDMEVPQPQVPAFIVNQATQDVEETLRDTQQVASSDTNTVVSAPTSVATNVSNITTGVIHTGGDSSLGHRHRVLPGIAS